MIVVCRLDIVISETASARGPRFPEVSAHIQQTNDSIPAGHIPSGLVKDIELEIAELGAAACRLRTTRNSCQPLTANIGI